MAYTCISSLSSVLQSGLKDKRVCVWVGGTRVRAYVRLCGLHHCCYDFTIQKIVYRCCDQLFVQVFDA